MKKFLKKIKETTIEIFSTKKEISKLQMTLTLLLVLCLILSNIVVVKSIDLFGISSLANTCSILVFPITYVLSDVFSEVYGYKWSRTTATWALIGTAICALIFNITIALPGNNAWTNQDALVTILGNTPQILIASLLAFWIGDWANDKAFQLMKAKAKDGKGFSIRVICSSLIGKYIDGFIFTFIGLSFLPLETKLIMVATCPFVQICLEIILLPLTSLIVKKIKKVETKKID